MFPIDSSTATLLSNVIMGIAGALLFLGFLLASANKPAGPLTLLSGVALFILYWAAPPLGRNTPLGEFVLVDSSVAVVVIDKARNVGVSDLSCLGEDGNMTYRCRAEIEAATALAEDRAQKREIQSMAGTPQ